MDSVPEKKMGKLRASYLLAVESFELLRKDKEVIWYVILNLISVFALLLVFIGGFVVASMTGAVTLPTDESMADDTLTFIGYGVLLLFYLCAAFITTYFGVALTSVVAARIAGGDKNFKDGIAAANARIKKIALWSLLTATVGVLLNMLSERFSWIGRLLGFAGQVAWAVLTYFMIPVIALEDLTVRESLNRSGKTFRETWGESIITNFSLGLFFGILEIFFIIATITITVLSSSNIFVASAVVMLGLIGFLAICIVHATLEAVVKVVLYQYAVAGKIPESFTPELIMGALTKKAAAAPAL